MLFIFAPIKIGVLAPLSRDRDKGGIALACVIQLNFPC